MANRGMRLLWCTATGAALVSAGCAKSPAGVGRGTRLIVTMQFQDPVKPVYSYFFVIRNFSDPVGQNGPVPAIVPNYGGNGFATGLTTNEPPFTDFVAFGGGGAWSGSASGYTIWHVPKDSVTGLFNPGLGPGAFIFRGEPALATPPNGGKFLTFELDLSQIAPLAGDPAPTTDDRPRYLQVNIIAVTTLPAGGVVDEDHVVDAFGDQSVPNSGLFNKYLTIDTTQPRRYTSENSPSGDLQEHEGDTYNGFGKADPAMDLHSWSIEVAN